VSEREPAGSTFFAADVWDGRGCGPVLWGAPYDRTTADRLAGSRLAPQALRLASQQLPLLRGGAGEPPRGWYSCALARPLLTGVELYDGGDLPLPAGLGEEQVDALVARQAATIVGAGALSCLVGGEHALTRAALRGVAAACGEPLTLLFFDAHPDCGLSHWGGSYPRDAFVDGILADGTVATLIQVGVRDLVHPGLAGPPAGVLQLSPRAARRLGPAGLAARIPRGVPLYLSLDIDVLAPEVAPATRTPAPGGFSFDELLDLVTEIAVLPELRGLDLMELDPGRDRGGMTGDAALQLLVTLVGRGGAGP